MATGDGLLVRLKPRGGILPLATAAAIAGLAKRHGNGICDLTARANLQIRGVRDHSLAPLLAGLDALGLVDADPEAEAVRNIVSSPLAGIDRCAVDRVGPTVAALEALLARDADLWRLPPKWSFVVDDGSSFSLREVSADIRFEVLPDGRLAVGLAAEQVFAVCPPAQVAGVAAALCRAAVSGDPARMADLVRQRGADAILHAAGLQPAGVLPLRNPTHAQHVVGHHASGCRHVLGLAPPFGTLTADALQSLAERAGAKGARELRLTPWRVILILGLQGSGTNELPYLLEPDLWITRADDPRLAVAACSGQPACHRGSTPVQRDAGRVADALIRIRAGKGIAVHVSGCSKGCAHPHPTAFTFVGRDGRYDLVRNGKPGDKPVAEGLTLHEALRRIETDPS